MTGSVSVMLGSPAVGAAATAIQPDVVPRQEIARLLVKDADLREALLGWAMSHTRHRQNAQDLYQETITRALDPDYVAWNRAHYATAGAFLGSVMNGVARNRLRSSYHARRADLDEQDPPQVDAPAANPEGQLLTAGRERKRADMEADLRRRIAGKTIPLAVLDWAARGVKGNKALAEKIGCTIEQVLAAKQLLREQGAIVRAARASDPGVS